MARAHLQVLDGLRGVAAISVVAYHFGGRAGLPYLMPHGYLAVDFFFVLSGFVVAHAYLDRLRTTMPALAFVGRRVIRLWPMLVPGTVLGAIFEVWRPNITDAAGHATEVVLASVFSLLALPLPVSTSMEQTIFPINGPLWSLFFELFASAVFLVVAKSSFPRAQTVVLAAAGLVGLVACAGVYGTTDVGPLITDWIGGCPRVLFSFFAGVLLSRVHGRLPSLGGIACAVVLVAVLATPRLPGALNPAFDLLAVILLFPALLAAAANTSVERAPWPMLLAGDISYPLYAVHYPLIRVLAFASLKLHLSMPLRVGVGLAGIAALCWLSWLLLRFYDRPLRRWLMNRLPMTRRGDDAALARVLGDG